MTKGCWVSGTQVRHYLEQYPKLSAKQFKAFVNEYGRRYKFEFSGTKHFFSVKQHSQYAALLDFSCEAYESFKVPIIWRTPKYPRLEFICPCCGKNKMSLRRASNGWACVNCLGLSYVTQSAGVLERGRKRIFKLRRELWGEDADCNLFEVSFKRGFDKPKGMHWKTFNRKLNRLNVTEQLYWERCCVWFDARYSDFTSEK
jgi:hypothetical protein